MGISTIQSYQGAKIFEAIGLSKDFIDKYFTGTVSRIGGLGIEDIQNQVEMLHDKAFDPLELGTDITLDSIGNHKSRSGKEEHLYNPKTIHLLQEATRTGNYQMFKEYSDEIDREDLYMNLRSLLTFNFPKKGIRWDVWLAQYAPRPTYSGDFTMWQRGTGNVDGISGRVDIDICYRDYVDESPDRIVFALTSPMMQGKPVSALQAMLNAAGYTASDGQRLNVDGKLGKRSFSAFVEFLNAHKKYIE